MYKTVNESICKENLFDFKVSLGPNDLYSKQITYPGIYKAHMIVGAENEALIDDLFSSLVDSTYEKYYESQFKVYYYAKEPHTSKFNLRKNRLTIHNANDLVISLKKVIFIMNNRYKMFREFKSKDFDIFNKKSDDGEINKKRIPLILFFIGPLHDMEEETKRLVKELMLTIYIKSRAAGIHIIIGTTKPSEVLNTTSYIHIPLRVTFRVNDLSKSKLLIGSEEALHLKNNDYIVKDFKKTE